MQGHIYQYFLFFLSISLLVACAEETNTEIVIKTTEKKIKDRLFLRTNTAYLRLRATPDIEAPILEVLPDNTLLEYLHDSTSYTTAVKYRNKIYNASWYKVKSKNTAEGWIYSALISFLPYLENKELAKKIEKEERLTANYSNQKLTKKQKKERSQPLLSSSLLAYQNYIHSLSISDIKGVSLAKDRFENTFSAKSNTKTCDAAFVAFFDYYHQVFDRLQKQYSPNYQSLYTEVERYGQSDMRMNQWTQELAKNGFNFAIKNKKVVIAKDLDFVYRVFYRECSTIMRSYMDQYEKDESTHWLDDQQLLISPQELTQRVLSWNYFVAKNPDFVWYNQSSTRLNQQLKILVNGLPKTPIFDKNNRLQTSFEEAYLYIAQNYPKSNIGKAFVKYTDLLAANDWKNSFSLRQAKETLLKEILF